jgi:hypothetical protein
VLGRIKKIILHKRKVFKLGGDQLLTVLSGYAYRFARGSLLLARKKSKDIVGKSTLSINPADNIPAN